MEEMNPISLREDPDMVCQGIICTVQYTTAHGNLQYLLYMLYFIQYTVVYLEYTIIST